MVLELSYGRVGRGANRLCYSNLWTWSALMDIKFVKRDLREQWKENVIFSFFPTTSLNLFVSIPLLAPLISISNIASAPLCFPSLNFSMHSAQGCMLKQCYIAVGETEPSW